MLELLNVLLLGGLIVFFWDFFVFIVIYKFRDLFIFERVSLKEIYSRECFGVRCDDYSYFFLFL